MYERSFYRNAYAMVCSTAILLSHLLTVFLVLVHGFYLLSISILLSCYQAGYHPTSLFQYRPPRAYWICPYLPRAGCPEAGPPIGNLAGECRSGRIVASCQVARPFSILRRRVGLGLCSDSRSVTHAHRRPPHHASSLVISTRLPYSSCIPTHTHAHSSFYSYCLHRYLLHHARSNQLLAPNHKAEAPIPQE